LTALEHRSLLQAFALGLTAGIVYFTGTLYWITNVMAVYGGLQTWVAVLVNAALIAYLSLFPALFAVITRRLTMRYGPVAVMAAPLVWVATELGRTHLFTGFPWVLLGYSQSSVLPVAQLASVVGVYGVSALVAAVSAAIVYTARNRPRVVPAASVAIILVAVAIWGSIRVARSELTRSGEPVRVGLVQGNVEQGEKWNPEHAPRILRDYLQLSRQAIGRGAQFLLWPESAMPYSFEEDQRSAELVRRLARDAHVPILLGSDEIERGEQIAFYNSAFLVQTDGQTDGVYRKMHLVPFGEYVPLKQVFFFAAPLVEKVSDFSAGESAVLLPVDGHRVSTAICYEVVYPDLVRRFVAGGSELLTTITNDAWFGRTSAPYQHFAQAAMRAIENGRYLVRAANTGISGIVDPYGRVIVESGLFEPAVIVGDARFLRVRTIYTQAGDVFAYASVAATLGLLLAARRRVQ
jgi:apolipoprotein N-acyltransferase